MEWRPEKDLLPVIDETNQLISISDEYFMALNYFVRNLIDQI
jgi:hypothetical protein